MKIGIVGLGLIGSCLGLDLIAGGHEVYGVARRQATCAQALALGVVTAASTQLASLRTCDVVFVCTPIATIVPMVAQLAQVLSPQAVITDVGSVKGALVETATRQWPRFVGGHPMSGKSEAGIEAAERGLFEGNSYVITPVTVGGVETDQGAIALIEKLAQELGSVVYHCTPAAHDRAVAWISHLPVMVSASLIHSAIDEPDETVRTLAEKLASSGFRDTSRVGGGNPELGLMMAKYNREEVVRSLKRYQQRIAVTIKHLEAEDWEGLAKVLAETKAARGRFLG
ncbi:MAG: prephenate/arogenate dehydrogenase [Cyanobacteria bacterium J06629_19]